MFIDSISYNVRLGTVIRQEDGEWMAWCVPLDVKTFADTKEEALEALKQRVDVWFGTLPHGEGILNKAKLQANWAEHLRWRKWAEAVRRRNHPYRRRRPLLPGPQARTSA